MTVSTLPVTTSLGAVHLTVTDLDRALAFYTGRLGFRLHERDGAVARLGAGGPDLLVLTGDPAAAVARGAAGLYHFAVLVPTRADLAHVLSHLIAQRTALTGVSDHGVSEALYLSDPEGNGIEIYRDRPSAEWPRSGGELRMTTEPLDVDGVLATLAGDGATWTGLPSGTRIGHVHLHVPHLDAAERFYVGVLGFDLVQRYGGAALFVSAGGYHHHIGLNTWAGVGAPAPPPGAAGLRHFDVLLPDAVSVAAIAERARAAGAQVVVNGEHVEIADPAGHLLHLHVQPA